ncbi:hypothetical protein GOP47_0002305 [Adiantum capillus-veneris]|uniref:Uncharacterized protein n=1 Tax=Adiantum capillus-veneris TaxID=13818 RepID=A0A9D4VAG4_ADICA|nr:hypothetical protein GOP47_0001732 [Adiantum capillus-veneris]KAI5082562.1 hypothetical protein GOP47_0002305 [Adiantum capillus-veneris]
MGEANEETSEWYVKGGQSRPQTSLGLPKASQSRSSSTSQPGSPEYLWKSSSRYIDPGYGYYRDWRSSRTRVEGGGDSHFGSAVAPVASEDQNQWRSSIRYINPGSGSCSAAEWRSSVKAVQTKKDEVFPQWKPAVRVFKLSECCTEWHMKGGRRHVPAVVHHEPGWRSCRGPGNPPPLMWAPPFRTLKPSPPKSKGVRRKVPNYGKKHPQLRLFQPTLDMAQRLEPGLDPGHMLMPNAKEIRAKVAAYFKTHPPLHLFSPSLSRTATDSSKDEPYHSLRRYISEGHEDHLETGCTPRPSIKPPLDSIRMWCAKGPQHDPANHRNVILGKIGPSDHWKPPPSLSAPAGNYHKDIVDGCFAGAEENVDPEIPSYTSTLFRRAV